MARSAFKSCFISAPFGVDTSVIREALEKRDILWRDQTLIKPGDRWIDVIDDGLRQSDFLCAVLGEQPNPNVFFEIGIAYSNRKPILAFVSSAEELLIDVPSLTYIRIDPTNRSAVDLALDTFIKHARPIPLQKTRRLLPEFDTGVQSLLAPHTILHAVKVEQQTAALLGQAGFIVSEREGVEDRGADFAVWNDQLEDVLGTPLLVEVKSGYLSTEQLERAVSQLQNYVARTHNRAGLLIYWDRLGRQFPPTASKLPLVIQLPGEELRQLVSQGRLVSELIKRRNMAFHGRT